MAEKRKPTRQQKWRKKHPRKYLAHITVQNALRLGVLEKQPCAICGAEKVDGHHPDYGNPLHVIWLCRRHHKQAHRKGGA